MPVPPHLAHSDGDSLIYKDLAWLNVAHPMALRSPQRLRRNLRLPSIAVILVVFALAAISLLNVIEKRTGELIGLAVAIPFLIWLAFTAVRKGR
jgi:hypothetical protein